MKKFFSVAHALGLSLLALASPLRGRTFTSSDGKNIDAEYVSSTDTRVTLKVKSNGREYTLPLERLSEADQAHVKELRAAEERERNAEAAQAAQEAAAEAARRAIVDFAKANLGKKIGTGDCWAFADGAYQAAGVKRPGNEKYVWGREVDWKEEKIQPGDVLQLTDAQFNDGARVMQTGPRHTAIVVDTGRKGAITVHHQNSDGKSFVTSSEYDLGSIISGTAKVYRCEHLGEGKE